jgi:hypothetical protein
MISVIENRYTRSRRDGAGNVPCSRRPGDVIPVAFLLSEELPVTKDIAARIGPSRAGVATYLIVGLAMVVGSLLKPKSTE